jgi:Fe-S cluster assembly iron-binding protein IscA
MMTLTPTAAQAVRALVSNTDVDDDTGGLRIWSSAHSEPGGALALSLVNGPEPTDQEIEAEGAHVFLEPAAAELLDGKSLDANVEDGRVQFVLMDAGPPVS